MNKMNPIRSASPTVEAANIHGCCQGDRPVVHAGNTEVGARGISSWIVPVETVTS